MQLSVESRTSFLLMNGDKWFIHLAEPLHVIHIVTITLELDGIGLHFQVEELAFQQRLQNLLGTTVMCVKHSLQPG